MSGLKKHKFAKVTVPQPETDTGTEGAALSEFAVQKVAESPRGAPITLSNPTPLVEDALNATSMSEPPCALDEAPRNSNITVVNKDNLPYPVLMTPGGELPLAHADVAHRLPIGGYIRRIAPTVGQWQSIQGRSVMVPDGMEFFAEQIGAFEDRPRLYTTTAREAVARFGKHFHDHKD